MEFAAIPPVADRLVQSVVAAHQDEAQAQLADRAWKAIDSATAASWVGDASAFTGQPGVTVVVRAVRSTPDASGLDANDSFHVRWHDGVVAVAHLAGRTALTPQARHALVILLPTEPREVFVECLVAIHGGLSKD